MTLTIDDQSLFTIGEAAHVAGVAPATVRWWIRDGRLARHVHAGVVHVTERQLLDVEHATRASGRGRPRGRVA